MSTDIDYTYLDNEKINNDYLHQRGSYQDDNLTIIKYVSNSQTGKTVAELINSAERIDETKPEYKEVGQFLYMDVGRWGGDLDTGDAWTRMRNFGLVCGSGAMLCNYEGHKGSSISKDPNLENISPEVWEHPDIQKMRSLLKKLSESNILGHVTVVNALVSTDEASESPSSDEILVFLGDIHAPVMNIHDRTYLPDSLESKSCSVYSGNIEARSRGRIKINDEVAKIKLIEKKVATFFKGIETFENKPYKIIQLFIEVFKDLFNKNELREILKEILKDLFESQQLNSLDNNNKIMFNDEIKSRDPSTIEALGIISEILLDSQQLNKRDNEEKIAKDDISNWLRFFENYREIQWNDEYTIKSLKIILRLLLKSQQLNKWDDNEKMSNDDALCWFDLYHGDGNNRGVDIFQNAGGDLCEFIKLLLKYQEDSHKQGLISVKLIQLGDLYDFWLGLKRAFDTVDPKKMFSDDAAKSFLEFWRKETISETSVSNAIYHLLKRTKDLHPKFVYGNHDSYRATPQWPYETVSAYFEATGVWAEHGHQSDAFNEDSNAVIGWSAAVFGFFDPEARNFEPYLRGAETWAFRKLCRRLTCIRHAACQCQVKNKRIYVMGHTHEPILKKVHIVESIC